MYNVLVCMYNVRMHYIIYEYTCRPMYNVLGCAAHVIHVTFVLRDRP